MHYSIYYFAVDSETISQRLKQQAEEIASEVVERMKAHPDFSPQREKVCHDLAKNICLGHLGTDEPHEEINILCWICEIVGEKIDMPPFNLFNRLAYLDDVGIWPLFQSDTPPFPVPICEEGLPEVSYMNHTSIKQHVESEFGQLREANNPGAEDARDELLGILESLAEDNLDLLAIFVEN
ncbi:MAG: hypothetical protein KDA52_13925 [Planctomycetaceae bacterium]|nr:hypothetical protein [Planctomycetaceae bacterium]